MNPTGDDEFFCPLSDADDLAVNEAVRLKGLGYDVRFIVTAKPGRPFHDIRVEPTTTIP